MLLHVFYTPDPGRRETKAMAQTTGQRLPISMGLFKQEVMGTHNVSFGMYPGLPLGDMNTIQLHGNEQQQQTYNNFLMYSGYVTMAYMWLRQVAVTLDKLANGGGYDVFWIKPILHRSEPKRGS